MLDLVYLALGLGAVFVGQLRQKIEPDASAPALIVTEPGVAYRWVG
jgi:two-component system KDP operon response regulator KdpE